MFMSMPPYKTCTPLKRTKKLIDLGSSASDQGDMHKWHRFFPAAEKLLAIDRINAVYQQVPENLPPLDFCRQILKTIGVDYEACPHESAQIPAGGPMVAVANHPFGGIEGLILTAILLQVRTDVRILGNYLLEHIPELAPLIIPVDPFDPRKSVLSNARALLQARRWVANGGTLLTFPSGEVSHFFASHGRVTDPPWSRHIAQLIRATKAKTQPIYIHGRNSVLFNTMGLIHPRLRTAMLPRELANKRAMTVEISIGNPLPWKMLAEFDSDRRALEFIRCSTYLLKYRKECKISKMKSAFKSIAKTQLQMESVIAPVAKDPIRREIENLAENSRLIRHKEYEIYLTTAQQSPNIMQEIGRLREVSFRAVGEGTGKEVDIDRFDEYYQQLFLWNHRQEEIIGAYRIGQTDQILKAMGSRGLYSTTLFKYKPELLRHLGCALELGRSFIRPEYQRKFGCLTLLWRGIGAFVAAHPKYHLLFGPVSISQDYHTISKDLMVSFLSRNTIEPSLTPLVKPRRAVKVKNKLEPSAPICEDLEEISLLVSEIEKDNKGVPTLIKHYLKMNGRFLAFNLDTEFSDVIDGLVLVDLLKTDSRLIEHFFGSQKSLQYYTYHGAGAATIAA